MDEKDRKIINILLNEASTTNAQVGEAIGLSGPGVHERFKRLRGNGIILGSRMMIDPQVVSASLLSFILLKAKALEKADQVKQLACIPEIEEIHSTAGLFSIMLKVRTKTPADMKQLYEKIYAIPGIEDRSRLSSSSHSWKDQPTYQATEAMWVA